MIKFRINSKKIITAGLNIKIKSAVGF